MESQSSNLIDVVHRLFTASNEADQLDLIRAYPQQACNPVADDILAQTASRFAGDPTTAQRIEATRTLLRRHCLLRRAFEDGLAMARDPHNASITDDHTQRVTTIYSAWYLTNCPVCRHTFREGDRVLPYPEHLSRMIHEDPDMHLYCWSRKKGRCPDVSEHREGITAIRDAFLQGLHAYWNNDSIPECLTVEPRSLLIGKRCPICRHTIRPGDRIVTCPCGRGCEGVFHQDISRHLTCWDTWNRSMQRRYCAFTGALY